MLANSLGLLGLSVSQSDGFRFLILSTAHEVEACKGDSLGDILNQAQCLQSTGGVPMHVQNQVLAFVEWGVDCNLNVLSLMDNVMFFPHIVFSMVFEMFST